MPRISEFYGIVIYMYYSDHAPPHFHAIYGQFEAEILIRSAVCCKVTCRAAPCPWSGNGRTGTGQNSTKIGSVQSLTRSYG